MPNQRNCPFPFRWNLHSPLHKPAFRPLRGLPTPIVPCYTEPKRVRTPSSERTPTPGAGDGAAKSDRLSNRFLGVNHLRRTGAFVRHRRERNWHLANLHRGTRNDALGVSSGRHNAALRRHVRDVIWRWFRTSSGSLLADVAAGALMDTVLEASERSVLDGSNGVVKSWFPPMLELFWNAAYSRRVANLFQNNSGGYSRTRSATSRQRRII
jgi:hypothetical protein